MANNTIKYAGLATIVSLAILPSDAYAIKGTAEKTGDAVADLIELTFTAPFKYAENWVQGMGKKYSTEPKNPAQKERTYKRKDSSLDSTDKVNNEQIPIIRRGIFRRR